MSTRANIVLKDGNEKLFFYRHSDGYPEGTMPTLEMFSNYIKKGAIRNNISQAAGWLILIGAGEYGGGEVVSTVPDLENDFHGWKVGAYEPTTGIHGDIEYLYTIDVDTGDIKVEEV